ncbi:MAG: dihydropteroate synthase [Kiritimatiellae bacterium]|nr:dihydropteroate synthase [Kiritimatiellia bacterium]
MAPPAADRVPARAWRCKEQTLAFADRPLVMGILNVTPDSFSDGGRYAATEDAVRHARRLIEEGADILDIGGESTRPGARPVGVDEELDRVLPVIRALRSESPIPISIDTAKAAVAQRAVEAGATIVNDVTALTGDPLMPEVVAALKPGVVLMHMRGTPRTMQDAPFYENVVAEVAAYLDGRVQALVQRGIAAESLAVDPGIGFGKTVAHNLELLRGLETLTAAGPPVVIGLSRKSFLGKITGREVNDRLAGSLAALACCVLRGAAVLRVHDVKESCDAVKIAVRLRDGGQHRRD